ncbi:MurR/RpiR family transcriptional regulator [Oribacterium sp. HCP28S3_H8]|uniref:MurR/RpiR family transcriptional regulator n=1 Tax=Oribacterium sp. HCP28S3_H8 TaxID=3438945 RepID=UPI00302EF0EC|nr:MurR/RpiR family transcriptional regulator [Oribacterium sp.]
MQEDYLTKIRSAYNQFTKAEKKVADYILANPNKVLFMSISDLAEACNVGDTSVFRFCKTMNVKGYQEFKMMLSLSMRSTDEDITETSERNITLEDDISKLAKKVLTENISAIQETYSLLDLKQMTAAMDLLSGARKIIFFGAGTSMLTAMKAMNKFLRIEQKVYCNEVVNVQLMTAATMSPDDVAVIFSYSGATKDTVEIARLVKEAGARTIVITRFNRSPLTEYADIILLCGANEGTLQSGSTSAEISQLFLVDIMYSEYYRRHYKRCSAYLEKTSKAIADKSFN